MHVYLAFLTPGPLKSCRATVWTQIAVTILSPIPVSGGWCSLVLKSFPCLVTLYDSLLCPARRRAVESVSMVGRHNHWFSTTADSTGHCEYFRSSVLPLVVMVAEPSGGADPIYPRRPREPTESIQLQCLSLDVSDPIYNVCPPACIRFGNTPKLITLLSGVQDVYLLYFRRAHLFHKRRTLCGHRSWPRSCL